MKTKNKLSYSDIPAEVWQASAYLYSGQPLSLETLKKVQQIVNKYTQYFPWEHKYASIPQEVHDAFHRECYPNPYKPKQIDSNTGGAGIIEQIKNTSVYKPIKTEKEFHDMWQRFVDHEEKARTNETIRLKREEEIWNKHYKKYNLPYRGK